MACSLVASSVRGMNVASSACGMNEKQLAGNVNHVHARAIWGRWVVVHERNLPGDGANCSSGWRRACLLDAGAA